MPRGTPSQLRSDSVHVFELGYATPLARGTPWCGPVSTESDTAELSELSGSEIPRRTRLLRTVPTSAPRRTPCQRCGPGLGSTSSTCGSAGAEFRAAPRRTVGTPWCDSVPRHAPRQRRRFGGAEFGTACLRRVFVEDVTVPTVRRSPISYLDSIPTHIS